VCGGGGEFSLADLLKIWVCLEPFFLHRRHSTSTDKAVRSLDNFLANRASRLEKMKPPAANNNFSEGYGSSVKVDGFAAAQWLLLMHSTAFKDLSCINCC